MELARMTDLATDIFRQRVKTMRGKLLDEMEHLIEEMKDKRAAAPKLNVARRLIANQFQLWRYCDHSRCRRSGCCRGEPRDCLHIGLPLLPLSAITEIVQPAARTAKRRRHKASTEQRPA
jgi:hypothetical protein